MLNRLLLYFFLTVSLLAFYHYGRSIWYPILVQIKGSKSVAEVIQELSPDTNLTLQPAFEQAGINFPPKKLALIAIKDEKIMHLWAANDDAIYQPVVSYPIEAASGVLGPKLLEGDHQVPEGLYNIIGFNPNSSYHLSMKLNYPNAFDLKYAAKDGRTEPGTNIFIHGSNVSVGCLAMGDKVVELLFALVHATGRKNTQVLILPSDPSKNQLVVPDGAPAWTAELYASIKSKHAEITQR